MKNTNKLLIIILCLSLLLLCGCNKDEDAAEVPGSNLPSIEEETGHKKPVPSSPSLGGEDRPGQLAPEVPSTPEEQPNRPTPPEPPAPPQPEGQRIE